MWKKLDNFASPRTDASANESLDANLTGEGAGLQDDPWQIGNSDREELEGDGSLDGFGGAVAGMADPEELFALLECDFDRPAL